MENHGHPVPGAVIVVGDRETADQARQRASRPFFDADLQPEVWQEGPATIAFIRSREAERDLHVSPTTLCLVEGALYEIRGEIGELSGGMGLSPAARLARAYESAGDASLPALRGELWAFLWLRDEQRGVVFCDQIGSRAPYWSLDGQSMIVASEVRELLAARSRQPEPDPVELAHWLMMTGPRLGLTLFAGVQSVRAGHALHLYPGRCAEKRYWDPVFAQPVDGSPAEQAGQLREALGVAVERRCAGVRTTGVLLSGGLDSSAVAALAARTGPVSAYSAVFPEHPSLDESALIDRTASQLGIDSTRIVVRAGSTIGGALAYTRAWQVPPTSPNLFFWAPLLQRAAADGIEVMIDGEGGDELFGFSPFLVADRLRQGRLLGALRLAGRWPGESRRPSRDVIRFRLREAGIRGLLPPAAHRLSRHTRGLESYAPDWLPRLLAEQWLDTEESAFAWKELSGPRWWAYLVYLVTRGAGPSAGYEQARRRCRLAGISPRHPLADLDVIELVLRLEPELGFDRRFNRAVLREAIGGLVPDEVRRRRGKSNFDALFHQLLAGPDLPAARKLLDPGHAELRAYVDIASLYDDLLVGDPHSHPAGLMLWAIRVWRLVTAELWLRSRNDSAALERL